MPLPTTDLLKHVLGGAIGGERWTVTVWARLQGLTGNPTAAQMNTLAAGVLTGFTSSCWSATSTLAKFNSSDTSIDSCHTYLYRGSFLVEQGIGVQAPVLGIGTNAHPGYVALVTTLLTAGSGRSRRGRLYWPATGVQISASTSQITSTADMQTLINAIGTWMTGFAVGQPSWPGTPGEAVCVVSQHLAVTNDVTSLRMDSLPDTQHGRTRRLVAAASVTKTL